MRVGFAGAKGGDLIQFVLALLAVVLFGWWLLTASASGKVAVGLDQNLHGIFVGAASDPSRYNGAIVVIGILCLVVLGRAASLAWDMIAPFNEPAESPPGVAGRSAPYFQFALAAFAAFCLVAGAGYVDSLDGEARMGRSLVREGEGASEFRGALIGNYGIYAAFTLVAAAAGALGGLAVSHANRLARK